MKILKKSLKSDRGDSELVSFILIIGVILAILVSIVDVGFYFGNRSTVQSAARDAARTVATMGGNGDASEGTPIELKYGLSKATACKDLDVNVRVRDAYNTSLTPIECNLLTSLKNNTSLINVHVKEVKCGPKKTEGTDSDGGIGESVYCTIKWNYNSLPLSSFSLIKGIQENSTTSYSQSDVDMTGVDLVSRNNSSVTSQ